MSKELRAKYGNKKVKKQRKKLIEGLHPEDELQVEEHKLKQEHNRELLKGVEEEEIEYNQERMIPEDPKHVQDVQDKKIEQGVEEGMIKDEKPEEIYDLEEAEELVDDDEVTSAEGGFVRGYEEEEEEHFSKKKKKK